MPFELRYHPDVKAVDIPQLDAKLKNRIKHAIETRLTTEPQQYGAPLRKTLRHGEEIVVTDRGKEIALVIPISRERSEAGRRRQAASPPA